MMQMAGSSRWFGPAVVSFTIVAVAVGAFWYWRDQPVPGVEEVRAPESELTSEGVTEPEVSIETDEVPADALTAQVPDAGDSAVATELIAGKYLLFGRIVEDPGDGVTRVPVAGVEVRFMPHPRRTKPEDRFPPRVSITGADGVFGISGVPPTDWFRFEIDPPEGRALQTMSFQLGRPNGAGKLDLGDILVEPGVTLTMSVTDADGNPVDGAQVIAKRDLDPRLDRLNMNGSRRKSDGRGQGIYVLERMEPGRPSVQVVARGFRRFKDYVDPDADGVHRIELEPGLVIAGVVADESGQPIAGAVLTAEGPQLPSPDPEVTTDRSGRFKFDILSEGDYEITASAKGYVESVHADLPAGGDDVAIELAAAAGISGRVVAAAGEASIAEARIFLVDAGGREFERTTAADGSFSIDEVVPGEYKVFVDHDQYAFLAAPPVTLEKGMRLTNKVYRLEPGVSIAGRLLNAESGGGVEGGSVVLTAERLAIGRGKVERAAVSDDEGRFVVSGLVPEHFSIAIEADGFLPADSEMIAVDAETNEELEILLEPGRSIYGRVVDAAGNPVAGASVRPEPVLTDMQRWPQFQRSIQRAEMQSRDDGTFRLAGLPPHDEYSVYVSRSGFADSAAHGIELGAERDVSGVEVTLLLGGAIAGRVIDDDGAAVAGVTVSAQREPTQDEMDRRRRSRISLGRSFRPTAAPVADDGTFEMRGLTPGTYNLSVSKEGLLPAARADVIVEDNEVVQLEDLVLGEGETLRGRVVSADGEAIEGAQVTWRGSSSPGARPIFRARPSSVETDERGEFVITGLAPGKGAVWAARSGYNSASSAATVPSTDLVNIVMSKAGIIRGRVVGPSDMRRVFVTPLMTGNNPRHVGGNERPGTGGEYQVEVPPGTYVIQALGMGTSGSGASFAPSESAEVTVAGGETVEGVDIEMPPGAVVRGRIVDQTTGEPVPDARITVQLAANDPNRRRYGLPSSQSQADGSFAVTGLAARSQTLEISHPQYAQTSVDVELDVGEEVEIVIELGKGGSIAGIALRGDEPISGLRISVQADGGTPGSRKNATTGADGRFEILGLPEGEYNVYSSSSSFNMKSRVTVVDGAQAEVELRREPGVVVFGTVFRAGEAMRRGRLTLFSMNGGGRPANAGVGPNGQYRTEVESPGVYRVMLQDGRFSTNQTLEVPAGVEEFRFDFHISSGGAKGVVVDAATGAPLQGVSVYARPTSAQAATTSQMAVIATLQSSAVTDSNGVFELSSLADGTYTVFATLDGYAEGSVRGVHVTGGVSDGHRIELGTGVGVRVTVVDSGDAPIQGAFVFLTGNPNAFGTSFRPQVTDAAGVLTHANVIPGSYTAVVRHAQYATTTVALNTDVATELTVRLDGGGTIEARVVDSGGRPIAGATIEVLSESGAVVGGAGRMGFGIDAPRTSATGTIAVERVMAGALHVRATYRGRQSELVPVNVETGKTTAVEIELDG